MLGDDVTILVLSSAALFLLITGFLGYFVVLYRNRQFINKQEQEKLQAAFRFEILKTQLEVQEYTLAYISRELHDNVNQVLSFVKLNLGLITTDNESISQKVTESRDLIGETINDLRNLSQSLSFERINRLGLRQAIITESEKINKSSILTAVVITNGQEYTLGGQRELVLFRIFQESVNNVLKHAAATKLTINFEYGAEVFLLVIEDNGKGFSKPQTGPQQGAGLDNIVSRAAMIGAAASIKSSPGEGCRVGISLNPLTKELYTDEIYSDSAGR